MIIEPGQFLLTRNLKESDNTSVGYWNHCAICVPDGIIEAQIGQGVILSDKEEFINRYPQIIVLDMSNHLQVLGRMVDKAESLLKSKYRKYMSIFFFLGKRDGENCVSLVRKCYIAGFTKDPYWLIPDDLLKEGKVVNVKRIVDKNVYIQSNS